MGRKRRKGQQWAEARHQIYKGFIASTFPLIYVMNQIPQYLYTAGLKHPGETKTGEHRKGEKLVLHFEGEERLGLRAKEKTRWEP